MRSISVLWLTGAPGVGKSTVGWELHTWARAEDLPVAYVDIDQLGLLAPPPTGDPDCHRLKAANLVEVVRTFRRHGAHHVIVSGVVDPDRGIEPYVEDAADLEFTLVRLRCTREELRRRYLDRGSTGERLDELMSVADAYDRNAVGEPFDTTTMPPGEVVRKLSDRIRPALQANSPTTVPLPAPRDADVPGREQMTVLLLAGPTAVGKSTVGWEVLKTLWERGLPAAYVDVEQLGFCHPDAAPKAKADNLLQVWRGYRRAGACALIVVARGEPLRYRQALADELVITVHLEASPSELAKRIAQRARGEGPRLAGDSLIGTSDRQRARTIERSVAEATALRRHRGAALVIDTDRETSSAVAAKLADVFRKGETPPEA
ncbi:AAA family ATPase [Nocardia transvalensis]|uniref:AAA family ATPase n=1 Tax=Nocardia transvalensis TaxID=37333 RepID=UPI00189543AA|nr:AAA family ATPase [Nocardia transvalensis]MBF6331663.1 AAA family ATPase [Nocardia transvalensis]